MISRNRPEARFWEIARAFVSMRRNPAAFLSEFAQFLQRTLELPADPVLMPSGRAALYFLFLAIPLRRVYLPAYTCWVVLEAARLAGKEVVLLDVDYPRLTFRSADIERIRDIPGIVVATHQFGFPEDVPAIRDQLQGKGHVIVEDCAGAMFARVGAKPVGSLGDAAIFSFETSKLWTLGRGGFVSSSDSALTQKLRELLRTTQSGSGYRTLIHLAGRRLITAPFFYRVLLPLYLMRREPTEGIRPLSPALTLDYLEAFSVGQANLGMMLGVRVGQIAQHRRGLFEYYQHELADVPGLTCVGVPRDCIVAPIRYPFLVTRGNKRLLYDRMRAAGADLGFTYSYLLGEPAKYPGAAKFSEQILNLPIYSDITMATAKRIVAALRRCCASS